MGVASEPPSRLNGLIFLIHICLSLAHTVGVRISKFPRMCIPSQQCIHTYMKCIVSVHHGMHSPSSSLESGAIWVKIGLLDGKQRTPVYKEIIVCDYYVDINFIIRVHVCDLSFFRVFQTLA